jgi:peptidoglycan glycosyltransferase
MNRQVRRVSAVLLVFFLVLFATPLYWQVLAADRVSGDPRNARLIIKEYSVQRGEMVLPDGKVVAQSVPSKSGDTLKYQREYPFGDRYGMITGYYSLVFGRSLAESQFNSFLLGKAPEQFAQNFIDLVTARPNPGGTLVLTLNRNAQEAAERALNNHKGAVVALDPSTGAVLAMTTFPRYDPNALTGHDTATVQKNWNQYVKDPNDPLLNRAAGGLYPPGSTFKVITAAAALENGHRPDEQRPNEQTYTPPQTTRAIQNFGGENCAPGAPTLSMVQALTISCNTFFAHLGVDLGATKLVDEARKFGLDSPSPFQLPGAAQSQIPTSLDAPATAQSAIGQRDVQVTPLQMAQVAATIANGGRRMAPYVVNRVVDSEDASKVIKRFDPQSLGQVIPSGVADQLKAMMGQVVTSGTGRNAQIPGLTVFGKTGTAQHGTGAPPHAWFIGATSQGSKSIAVAVVVEDGGSLGSEATGGHVAAPIAKAVMEAYLGVNR